MSRPPPSPAVIALALRLYAGGATYAEIGAGIGYPEGSVSAFLERHLPDRAPRNPGPVPGTPPVYRGGRYPPYLNHLTDAQRDEYRTLRRGKGFTVAEALAAVSP